MTKETAAFVVQNLLESTAKHCIGSELRDNVKNETMFAVQQDSAVAQKWIYRTSSTIKLTTWDLRSTSQLDTDLGLSPRYIPARGSCEFDMWMGDDFAIYYVYNQYLLKSTDGVNWSVVNDDLPFHAKGYELNIEEGYRVSCNYIDGNVFVFMQGYIYKSSDDGVTWKEVLNASYYYKDRYDPRIRKAYDQASGTTMLFCCPGYYHKNYATFYYSLDSGETWSLFQPYCGKSQFLYWHDSKQTFITLQQYQGDESILSIPMESFLANDEYGFRTVKEVSYSNTVTFEYIIITPKYLFLHGCCSGYDVILDHDYNTLHTERYSKSWNTFRHGTHVQYDPHSDDVLGGEFKRKGNSTSNPVSGRVYLSEVNKGVFDLDYHDQYFNRGDTATMIYHPPTEKYYQAGYNGIYSSFKQPPGDPEFKEKKIETLTQNLDEIKDDALLCCTDTDGIAYSVTGAQFKELMTIT